MTFKCEECGAVKIPTKVHTSHGVHTVYDCPQGCGGNSKNPNEPMSNIEYTIFKHTVLNPSVAKYNSSKQKVTDNVE